MTISSSDRTSVGPSAPRSIGPARPWIGRAPVPTVPGALERPGLGSSGGRIGDASGPGDIGPVARRRSAPRYLRASGPGGGGAEVHGGVRVEGRWPGWAAAPKYLRASGPGGGGAEVHGGARGPKSRGAMVRMGGGAEVPPSVGARGRRGGGSWGREGQGAMARTSDGAGAARVRRVPGAPVPGDLTRPALAGYSGDFRANQGYPRAGQGRGGCRSTSRTTGRSRGRGSIAIPSSPVPSASSSRLTNTCPSAWHWARARGMMESRRGS